MEILSFKCADDLSKVTQHLSLTPGPASTPDELALLFSSAFLQLGPKPLTCLIHLASLFFSGSGHLFYFRFLLHFL
jgi:hypothetical protein